MKVEITSKCGEILRNGPGIYAFSCAFCNEQFDSTKTIIEHIENLHFMATDAEELCLESQNTVTETEAPQTIFLKELKIELDEEYEHQEYNDTTPFDEYENDEDSLEIQSNLSASVEITPNNDIDQYLKCDICDELIRNKHCMDEHMRRHTDSIHACSICPKILTSKKGLIDHMTVHDNNISVCPYCDKLFCSRTNLFNHFRLIHKLTQTISQLHFPCSKCDKSFDALNDLLNHDFIHQENLSKKIMLLLQCDICKKLVENRRSMMRHMNKHIKPEYACPKCDAKVYTKAGLTVHLMRHTDSLHFRCATCTKVFFDKTEYDEHLDKHQFSKIECLKCNTLLLNRSMLRHHLKLMHNERTPTVKPSYKCSFCEKSFFAMSKLKRHTLSHTGKKEYTCEMCGKMFRDYSNLIPHLRTHKGEKLFKCTMCDKSFSHSSYIKIHMRVHTGERPFKCDLCDKAYKVRYLLTQHKLKWHLKLKPFKCQFCDRAFGDNYRRKEHERTHTGAKPFECSVCSLPFARRKNLRQHLLIHSDQKPYKCDYCDKTFAQAVGKYGHERNIHKRNIVVD